MTIKEPVTLLAVALQNRDYAGEDCMYVMLQKVAVGEGPYLASDSLKLRSA